MSSPVLDRQPRQHLSARQAETVDRLTEAGLLELRAVGYADLTVRSVARRAGVSPATAYTYFASREHLISEVFARQVRALPPVDASGAPSPADRVRCALQPLGDLLGREPRLAEAATPALLAPEPDVARIRDQVGLELQARLRSALGAEAPAGAVRALDLALGGALLRAGTGHLPYADIVEAVVEVASLVTGGDR